MSNLYMRTENNVPTGVPKVLPARWENHSGFDTFSDAKLKSLGWYPVDVVAPPAYNPDEQFRSLEYVLNEDSITPTYTIEDFLDVGRIGEWCQVQEGAITGGPFKCPKVWDGVQMYLLTEEEINAMDWYQYSDTPPAFDPDTEYLSHVNEIIAGVPTAVYTVNDYDAEQLASNLEQAQTSKLVGIRAEAEVLILADYPIWYQSNVATGIYDSDVGDPMKAAIAAIIAASNTAEDAVEAALTPSAVNSVTPVWP